jgi:hypothetical protein
MITMSQVADPSTVLCARLYDNVACSDSAALARVRFGHHGHVTGWTHVRHDALAAATGHDEVYWEALHKHARVIVARITELVDSGAIPHITDFAELHAHGDPNTGWSEKIDNLEHEAWVHTQWLVTDMLRFPDATGTDQWSCAPSTTETRTTHSGFRSKKINIARNGPSKPSTNAITEHEGDTGYGVAEIRRLDEEEVGLLVELAETAEAVNDDLFSTWAHDTGPASLPEREVGRARFFFRLPHNRFSRLAAASRPQPLTNLYLSAGIEA